MSELSATAVNGIFMDCLFVNEEIGPDRDVPSDAILVDGITRQVGFHAGRVQEHADEIRALLAQLPSELKDGTSFLALCNDKHGEQWTGFHRSMEELVILGLAIGELQLCAPRELWPALPGGMPYYQWRGAPEQVEGESQTVH